MLTEGYIRCAVPDGFFPNKEYQNVVKIGGPGPKGHPAASHKIVYNYNSITTMFKAAGFTVKLLEYCDEKVSYIIIAGTRRWALFIVQKDLIIGT